ncbi:MAG: hypothetical protein LYZ69_05215 [Nitrososphaerales archaeon]|nr:hypothetical protein [Nitrososphaerales archaeon]
MADPIVLTVLAYAHVLSAVGWLGSALLSMFVLLPGLGTLSQPAKGEFTVKVMPGILRFIMITGGSTIVFGLALLYVTVDGDFSQLAPASTFGASISAGMTIALIAFVLGLAVTTPNFRKIIRIVKEMGEKGAQESPPELGKYLARSRALGTVNVLLLLVALGLMVAAGFY